MVELEGRRPSTGRVLLFKTCRLGSAALPRSGEPPSQGSHSTWRGWASLRALLGVGPHLCALDWDVTHFLARQPAWEPSYVCRSTPGWGCCSRPPRRAATQAREACRAPSPTCTSPGSGRDAEPARTSREWQCPQSCAPRPEAGGQGRRSRSAARLPTTEQARGARRPRRASSLPAA